MDGFKEESFTISCTDDGFKEKSLLGTLLVEIYQKYSLNYVFCWQYFANGKEVYVKLLNNIVKF